MDDLIPPVSNSELQLWTDCRRRWYVSNVLEYGLSRDKEPLHGALTFGARMHIALQRLYENGESPLEVFEELHSKAVYELLIREATSGFIDADARKKLQGERELGHAMLAGFVAWAEETGVDEGLELAGAEIVVEVASGIPGVRLRGKLDQRIYRVVDGARLFRDFKTAASLKDGPAFLPLDEQMKFYMLLERLDALQKVGKDGEPELTQGGLYLMLKKVKRTERATPPFYDQVEVHHNRLTLESMWLRTHKRIEEMLEARHQLDAGGDHRYWVYPHPTRDCRWKCPFFAICPVMDDSPEETWRALLAEHYEHRDPYERYAQDDVKD